MAEKALLDERRKLVRDFREQIGMGLVEFGKLAKVSHPMLCQFENGDRDLSAEAWKRVQDAIAKAFPKHRSELETKLSRVEEIVGKLEANVGYPALIRKYDAKTYQESRDNQALAENLRSHLNADDPKEAKEAAWLEAEVAAETAAQRAMDAAAKVHRDYEPDQLLGIFREADGSVMFTSTPAKPYKFRETMAMLAYERDKESGKILPWKRKKLSKPKPEPHSQQFDICIARNPQEEAALLASGWQLVKSE